MSWCSRACTSATDRTCCSSCSLDKRLFGAGGVAASPGEGVSFDGPVAVEFCFTASAGGGETGSCSRDADGAIISGAVLGSVSSSLMMDAGPMAAVGEANVIKATPTDRVLSLNSRLFVPWQAQ